MEEKDRFGIVEVDDILQWIRLMQELQSGNDPRNRWIFRGQSSADWKLKTLFERKKEELGERLNANELRLFERLAIESFQREAYRYCRDSISDVDDTIEWLGMMQHYGVPTRLLDFTESPYVALYFAAENAKDKFAVWAVHLGERNWRESNQKIKEIKSRHLLPDVPQWGHARDPKSKELIRLLLIENYCTYPTLADILAENRIKANKILTPGFIAKEYEGLSFNLRNTKRRRGVIPLRLKHNNARISAQSGLFLFPTSLASSFWENLKAEYNLKEEISKSLTVQATSNIKEVSENLSSLGVIKFVFSSKVLDHALAILRDANISAMTLFPGLEGVAKSVSFLRPVKFTEVVKPDSCLCNKRVP